MKLEVRRLDTGAVQTKICFTLFLRCSAQSLPTVEWFKLRGVIISQYLQYFSRYRGTAIHRESVTSAILLIPILMSGRADITAPEA